MLDKIRAKRLGSNRGMEGKRNETQDYSFSFFFCTSGYRSTFKDEFPNKMNAIETLLTNAEVIIGQEELEKRISAGKRLKVKFGVDPTRPDLTLGHMVVFEKLRQFQEMGHEAILLIGDYTAQIGDPSGRSALRPVLTANEVETNAKTYLQQAFRILDESNTTIRRNSEWFNKMSFGDCLNLARNMTVAQMLERDDFAKRHTNQTPISIVEFLYPLVQGYDSVVLQADIELGGSDQLFNMLVGRSLQKDAGKPEQAVLTMPLLIGLDGSRKMSKSYDNYIAFNDNSKDMFGKVMSIPDDAMWDYYRLLLLTQDCDREKLRSEHPMEVKKNLAKQITAKFHGKEEADKELAQFEKVFSKGETPDEMPIFNWTTLSPDSEECTLVDIIAATNLFESKGGIRRLIKQGAVKINDQTHTDAQQILQKPDSAIIMRAGKRKYFQVSP